MSVKIEIFGETASEAFEELKILSGMFNSASAGRNLSNAQLSGLAEKVAAMPLTEAGGISRLPAFVASTTPQEAVNHSTSATIESPEKSGRMNVEEIDDGSPDVDAAGWPWSPELHASTKGTTKDGLWRMKIGVTRPDPKPGFPKDTGTSPETATTSAPEPVVEAQVVSETSSAQETVAEDDEFAAFRAAAAKSDAEDEAAKVGVPARKWTDADLGALCNQAATKLGDPTPIKEIIAQFIPEGVVAHSRNIPEDQREDFAAAIEAKAGIEFAG